LAGEKLGIAETPDEVYTVLLKCWEKVTKQRPQMQELFDDLENIYGAQNKKQRVTPIKTSDGNSVQVEAYHNNYKN
jgi:hypothetical protein